MRKLLVAALGAAVAVSGFAMFANAGTGPGDTSWTFKVKPNRPAKSAGTRSLIEPAVRDDKGTEDEADDSFATVKKVIVIFTKGATVDTAVPKRCKESGGDLARSRGSVCKKAQIGTGAARSVIGEGENKLFLNADIKAYNKKGGIFFLIQPCAEGTGPTTGQACTPLGDPFVLEGRYRVKNRVVKLIVPTPKSLIDNNIRVTRFQLKTDNITKKRRRQGKTIIRAYVTTPGKCKGKWTTKAKIKYTDRGPLTIEDTQICRKK